MANTLFLLQMAGPPGSGKSALARTIGRCTGAVVLDKDVIKTAALAAGAEESLAAPLAYEAFFALADHLLGQGQSVVLDSPSFWENIPTKGATIAAERMVAYYFIECVCPDEAELARRRGVRPSGSDTVGTPSVGATVSDPEGLTPARGYDKLFRESVLQAPDGCDFDFLRP